MTENPFTKNHEPRGFLVQSQGNGQYMILRQIDGCWARIAQDIPTYTEACDFADRLAEPTAGPADLLPSILDCAKDWLTHLRTFDHSPPI